jgi:hypothetical protein
MVGDEVRLFCFFGPFCERISQMRPSWKDFKKMDPQLGAMDSGAEVRRLGATDHGA